uniref:Rhodanese domain-containing protein n=1 Tax=Caenorhabditis japonica TaxID=281687 RepID=A0A8R1HW15_CAEJA
MSSSSNTNSIVNVQWLLQNLNNVKVIDASYIPTATRNFEEFQTKYILWPKVAAFTAEHIPGAVHFGLDTAYFPSKFIKFDLYPPEIFQKYIRLLGVNNDDHVVIYSRGPAAGMMFASRAYWTFKDGKWGREELIQCNNFLFSEATGSHVTGAISFPMANVIGSGGFISKEDVDSQIAKLGVTSGDQVYVACNTGIQASVIFVALERSGVKAKLYNGSMTELAYRAPELVNATGSV